MIEYETVKWMYGCTLDYGDIGINIFQCLFTCMMSFNAKVCVSQTTVTDGDCVDITYYFLIWFQCVDLNITLVGLYSVN